MFPQYRGKGRALDITVEQFVTDRLVNVPFLKVNILDVQQSEHFSTDTAAAIL
jgi:hypothetical protein